jgi:GAF domain-containing protein
MPIDPAMLAKSIGTLTDLHPDQDLPATLQQAVIAAKQLFDADAAGVMLVDIDGQLRWASASDERGQTLEDNQEVFAAGPCMEAYNSGGPAVMHDATMEHRWGEITLTFVEVQIRSGLSVPVELGGGPSAPWMCTPLTRAAGTTPKWPPSRPMPGSWPACCRPGPRPSSAAP